MIDHTPTAPTVFVIETKDVAGRAKLVHVLSSMEFRVKQFPSGEAFLAEAPHCTSGCLVTQLHLPGMSGMEVHAKLRESRSLLPVILFANRASTQMIVRSMRDGAISFLDAPINEDELWMAVREAFVENTARAEAVRLEGALAQRFSHLSDGESQVLSKICEGFSNKQIATHLDVSVRTVESRKRRLLTKTNSDSVPELLITFQRFRTSCKATHHVGPPLIMPIIGQPQPGGTS